MGACEGTTRIGRQLLVPLNMHTLLLSRKSHLQQQERGSHHWQGRRWWCWVRGGLDEHSRLGLHTGVPRCVYRCTHTDMENRVYTYHIYGEQGVHTLVYAFTNTHKDCICTSTHTFTPTPLSAQVLIANRNRARSEQLVKEMGPSVATVVDWEAVLEGNVQGDVLANTTSVGMAPKDDVSPVPAAALGGFAVVFDAVYTPLETKLLKDAAAAGCGTVTGLEMFVGQAAEQFELFTGKPADVELMRNTVLASL